MSKTELLFPKNLLDENIHNSGLSKSFCKNKNLRKTTRAAYSENLPRIFSGLPALTELSPKAPSNHIWKAADWVQTAKISQTQSPRKNTVDLLRHPDSLQQFHNTCHPNYPKSKYPSGRLETAIYVKRENGILHWHWYMFRHSSRNCSSGHTHSPTVSPKNPLFCRCIQAQCSHTAAMHSRQSIPISAEEEIFSMSISFYRLLESLSITAAKEFKSEKARRYSRAFSDSRDIIPTRSFPAASG